MREWLPLLFALGACGVDQGPITNNFAGCYDNSCVDAPVLVPGVPPLSSLSALTSHTCGLTPSGEAWCWGNNTTGQLGDGTDQPRGAPVKVAGNLRFSAISVGSLFTCALALEDTAHCWGIGATGQLGGQRVRMALEEDMTIDASGKNAWALRRQTEFHLVR